MTLSFSDKRRLREHYLHQRRELSAEARQTAALSFREIFLHYIAVPSHAVIAGYIPIRGEIDIFPLIEHLHRIGRRIALPVLPQDGKILEFHLWQPGAPLEANRLNIPEPPRTTPVMPSIVVVPLLAFDEQLHRLGYGGGYYDATLASLRAQHPMAAIGAGYDWQRHPTGLPATATDAAMDRIVTDQTCYTGA